MATSMKCSNNVILQVSEKTQELNIGKMEAIFEVYTDLLVESAGGFVDQALLWILRQDIKEFCVRVYQSVGLNYLYICILSVKSMSMPILPVPIAYK